MWFSKDKPYVVTFWGCSKKRTTALLSQQFNIQLTVVEMISARTLGSLQRLIERKCEGRWSRGPSATDIVFGRLKSLIPDGEPFNASTRLRDIKGFHYARLSQLIWREYDWRVPQTPRIPHECLKYLLLALALYGHLKWFRPFADGIGQPGAFFAYLIACVVLIGVVFAIAMIEERINQHWPRRYPAGVETVGQLTTYLAGMNQGILLREGAAFDGDLIWSGIVGIFTHYHRIPVHRLTPKAGWRV